MLCHVDVIILHVGGAALVSFLESPGRSGSAELVTSVVTPTNGIIHRYMTYLVSETAPLAAVNDLFVYLWRSDSRIGSEISCRAMLKDKNNQVGRTFGGGFLVPGG